MDKRYRHLASEERGVILAENRRGASLREIGGLLGPPVSGMLSAALLFLYFSGERDRTLTWDIQGSHWRGRYGRSGRT